MQNELQPNKRIASAAAPPTPLTAASMDSHSEDDFMSGMSSEDDVLQDESDNESDGEFVFLLRSLLGRTLLIGNLKHRRLWLR